MARTNQGGSVLSFVMVGIILVSLLVGGIYLVNRQTTTPQPPPTPQQPQEPAEEQPGPSPAEPDVQPDVSSSQTPPSGTAQLPATGSKEVFGSLLVFGVLSAVTVSYVRSRRPQLSL